MGGKNESRGVKKDQELALALYETGNYDAMYLAGLSVNLKLIEKETLQNWVKKADWYMLAEYTVADHENLVRLSN